MPTQITAASTKNITLPSKETSDHQAYLEARLVETFPTLRRSPHRRSPSACSERTMAAGSGRMVGAYTAANGAALLIFLLGFGATGIKPLFGDISAHADGERRGACADLKGA